MQQASGHTLKAFDEDIERLRALISQMGGLAEHAIDEAMRCLVQRDVEGAAQVVAGRQEARRARDRDRTAGGPADRASRADGRRSARRGRRAQDLRRGRAHRRLCQEHRQARAAARKRRQDRGRCRCFRRWRGSPTEMVHDVLDAFVARDADAAVRVCERDDAVDDFYDSIFRTLLTHMMENPQNDRPVAHLLFVAKNLERVGDHATNIAEMVYYAATGEPHGRPARQVAEVDRCRTSACCWSRTIARSPIW